MGWDGRNRRKFSRVLFPCLIKIRDSKEGKDALLTHTENVSIGGVRVILKNKVPMATLLDIEIDLMDAAEHLTCLGKVVWSEKRKSTESVKPDFFDIGIEFMGVNEADRKRLESVIGHNLKRGNQI